MAEVESYIHEAFEGLRDPFAIIGADKNLLFVNASFRELVGVDTDRPNARSFWPDVDSYSGCNELSSSFIRPDGEKISVYLSVRELSDSVLLVRVLRAAELGEAARDFHVQRLETLGLLAGGVAHDFNNLLTGILGHISYLKTILPKSGAHVESLSAIENGARKSSLITQQILNFSKTDLTDEPAVLDLCQVIPRTCALLRGAISPEYNLRFKVSDTPVNILGIESRLAQIIVNLVINARDAIGSGGFIEVSTDVTDDLARVQEAFLGRELAAKRYARLTVLDNGHGMTQEVQKKIFTPFFTTKKGKGTGLGLALVASIVQSLGGCIDISSQENVGTSLSLFIPLYEGEKEAVRERGREELVGGEERILVIDDESPVRNVLSMSLQHLGYTVETAASGDEGLEKFRENEGAFDLVILDMLMPKLSGDQVFVELQKLRSDVNVLIVSGFSSEEAVKRMLAHGGRDFMQKPFTIQELSRKVRECLGGR